MRDRFIDTTTAVLDEDPRTAVVLADISAASFAEAARRHPDRVVNVGIREQLMIGVAGGSGFTLEATPDASGLPYADVWQGVLDAERTWGGVTLSVDENVARRPSPSGGAP